MGFLGNLFFNYGSWVLTPLHVVVCFILIAVVLMQAGKGADFAGAFGGGGTQTAFGPRGVENTLSRMTKFAAVLFMVTSLGLSLVGSKASRGGGLKKELDLPSQKEMEQKKPAASESTAIPSETAPAAAPAAVATPVDQPLTATPADSPTATDAPATSTGGSTEPKQP